MNGYHMTFQEFLEQLTSMGLDVHFGRHFNAEGYWCEIQKEDIECISEISHDWRDCGHGLRLSDAVVEALLIFYGYQREATNHSWDFKSKEQFRHV